ncbi:hypothetical protein THARTR1_09441 [Trichoderma harzianum]|uniref:Uncharacterized protein n=1 Tax=Trichoderma harzianum TaxID=5544 RepID=A0A2K0TWP1_TRIHA|nr:hypothetical protein THARTR1_09441 [Trichoderma harzianum]
MDSSITDKYKQTVMDKAPTDSHDLAQESVANIDPQLKDGDRYIDHNTLQAATSGWNSETATPIQLSAGIRNGDFWTLIRRFNKQIFHVKRIDKQPLSNLDMNIAAGEDITAEKVQAHAERFYMTVVLLMNLSSGEFSQEEEDSVGPEHVVQDVSDVVNADQSGGKNHDRTKEPVARAVHSFHTRSALHIFPELIDTYERLGNALSPTSPFPIHRPRLIMATCLLPLLMISCFGSCYGVMKVLGLFAGAVFFGKPIIERGVSIIDDRCPDWRRHTEMRNSILRGVPTNAQIAITLLRTGENNKTPQPPPPPSHGPPNVHLNVDDYDLAHLGASQEDTKMAINPVSDEEYSKQTYERQEEGEPSTTRRIAKRIKRTTKDGIQAINKIAKAAEPSNSGHLQGEQSALKTYNTGY